jgi:hypothetical protein
MVEIIVAKTAIDKETDTASIISLSLIRFAYQRRENPEKCVNDLELLNEKNIVTAIGR